MGRGGRTRSLRVALVLVVSLLGAVACGSGGEGAPGAEAGEPLVIDGEEIADAELIEAARAEGTLTLYTALSEEPELALQEAFTEDTGITIESVRLPTNRLLERVRTEFGAGQLAADAIRMPDFTYIRQLVDDGVFRPYQVAAWDEIDDEYKDPEGLYYSWSLGPTAFGVNTEVVSEDAVPASYEDLLDPALQGQIGFASMDVGTTAWIIAMYQRETYGVEYWEQLAAQEPALQPGNAQVADQVGRGEVGVGITRPNVILAQVEQGAPVEMVWPEDGVPMLTFYLGAVEGGEHPRAAEVFLNWSMSRRGQQVAGSATGEYPVRDEVGPPEMMGTTFPPLDELNVYLPEEDVWVENRESWTDEWNDIFGVGS